MLKRDYRDPTKEQLIELLEARDRKKSGLLSGSDAIGHDRAHGEDLRSIRCRSYTPAPALQ